MTCRCWCARVRKLPRALSLGCRCRWWTGGASRRPSGSVCALGVAQRRRHGRGYPLTIVAQRKEKRYLLCIRANQICLTREIKMSARRCRGSCSDAHDEQLSLQRKVAKFNSGRVIGMSKCAPRVATQKSVSRAACGTLSFSTTRKIQVKISSCLHSLCCCPGNYEELLT